MVFRSPAKLNLYLQVIRKRRDNYHEIKSIFERISLCDTISIKPLPEKVIRVRASGHPVPRGENNLAFRAAQLLQERCSVKNGAEIKIVKRIPVGSGMGGGSSNAASVLLALNKLWKLNLPREKLAELAQEIGSDVPFFIHDLPFALIGGRGEKVKPIKKLGSLRLWHIIIVPKINVSTPYIYAEFDKQKVRLTKPKYDVNILTSVLQKKGHPLIAGALFNSLEQVTTGLYPGLVKVKEKLAKLAVKSILMSGSGPAIFGIVSSQEKALVIKRQLEKWQRWNIFVARTL